MSELYNSSFEMMLRIILLLSNIEKEYYSEDRIFILDFISCYAADFDLSYSNLHGYNDCKFGEFANRRQLVRDAIKNLVVKGLVDVKVENGYLFSISKLGIDYANRFECSYAENYKEISKLVIEKYRKESDINIMKLVRS